MISRPNPVLRRLTMQIVKGSPITAAYPATIKFYKQGATVKTEVSPPIPNNGSAVVSVYHTGTIVDGDVVQLGADETKTLTAVSVDPAAATIELLNETGSAVSIPVGTRLVRVANASGPDPALIYDDPLGSTAGASSKVIVADDEGWLVGYLRAYRYDLTVSAPGLTAWVLPDQEGSWVT